MLSFFSNNIIRCKRNRLKIKDFFNSTNEEECKKVLKSRPYLDCYFSQIKIQLYWKTTTIISPTRLYYNENNKSHNEMNCTKSNRTKQKINQCIDSYYQRDWADNIAKIYIYIYYGNVVFIFVLYALQSFAIKIVLDYNNGNQSNVSLAAANAISEEGDR
ncbi:hypothetical protein RFI_39940 [Reticulomyxa filosa]|uniref:Uncharacterized protein n=1 Tax=Reticulomyxa filosa TaxID=46433 RepID=X6LA20_RETFI|nr:hypothetical protein RFI_39940 [Reticulomyxa filosa]|eukprot:ETN97589.1 hypothetical protein RFI_39940 [Reticulomyxa filosa]